MAHESGSEAGFGSVSHEERVMINNNKVVEALRNDVKFSIAAEIHKRFLSLKTSASFRDVRQSMSLSQNMDGIQLKNLKMLKAYRHELIPGIPDDITLDQIAPRLPWRTVLALPSASRAWLTKIRRRKFYHARVRSNSTETLALIKVIPFAGVHAVALYSLRDNHYWELPPVPHLNRGIPLSCECVSFDGKVYVVGGAFRTSLRDLCTVYVLDLAGGQGQWKQCASMHEPRQGFGCGAINGKIYVFGGYIGDARVPVMSSEVYDPEENIWSPMTALASLRSSPDVATAGEELFVHCGWVVGDEYFDWVQRLMDSGKELTERVAELRETDSDDEDENENEYDYISEDYSLEIYHPVRDVWRKVEHFRRRYQGPVFVAQSKIYLMGFNGTYVYDMDRNVWSHQHSHFFPDFGTVIGLVVVPLTVQAVDDELLAIVSWSHVIDHKGGTCLVRSRGFHAGNKEIVWKKAQVSLPFLFLKSYFILPLQL